MKANQFLLVFIIGSFSALLSGCFSEDTGAETVTVLPEVNNANCKKEIIMAIEPKSAREEFAGKCARRGTFKPSTGKTWGPSDLY
ncbi:entry exclusion lipoprotein TrbK [Shewanella indica]|uniref:Entry exclusion lipoprotein TrbK n=1 Tax=Shewanella indica TaxID=768528 RepID=A0ABU4QJX6_9GAMM|nr:entry exclusion lipoprotein TrbK [Shewanella indica]MDX6018634.1 entry exclusion lipoprotein TrbK [Shewanella indica]